MKAKNTTKKRTKIKVRNIRCLQKTITEHADQYAQWLLWRCRGAMGSEIASCGSAACLAGWSTILSMKLDINSKRDYLSQFDAEDTMMQIASKFLGLTVLQAQILFTANTLTYWPLKFRITGDEPKVEQAQKACAYLDYIIETGDVWGRGNMDQKKRLTVIYGD